MKLNDKKILASAYLDEALTAEEKQWAEEQIANDGEIQAYLEICRKVNHLTHDNLTRAEMPHTLEYNWQKCRAAIRSSAPQSTWHTIFGSLRIPKLAWTTLGVIILASFAMWRFTPSESNLFLAEKSNEANASRIQTITIPVSYAENSLNSKNPSIDNAWSPRPEISVTSFPAGKASVIWLSGMPYRSENNPVK